MKKMTLSIILFLGFYIPINAQNLGLSPISGNAKVFYNTFNLNYSKAEFVGESDGDMPSNGWLVFGGFSNREADYLGSFKDGYAEGFGKLTIDKNKEKDELLDWSDKKLGRQSVKAGFWKKGYFNDSLTDSLGRLTKESFDFHRLFDLPAETSIDSFSYKVLDALFGYDLLRNDYLYSYYLFTKVSFYIRHPNSGRYLKFVIGFEIFCPNPYASAEITAAYFNQNAKDRVVGNRAMSIIRDFQQFAAVEFKDWITRGGGVQDGNFVTKKSSIMELGGRYCQYITILVRRDRGYPWREMGTWRMEWKKVSDNETRYYTNTKNGLGLFKSFFTDNMALGDIQREAEQMYYELYSSDKKIEDPQKSEQEIILPIDIKPFCFELERRFLDYVFRLEKDSLILNKDWTDDYTGAWYCEKDKLFIFIKPDYSIVGEDKRGYDENGETIKSLERTSAFKVFYSYFECENDKIDYGINMYTTYLTSKNVDKTFFCGLKGEIKYNLVFHYGLYSSYPNADFVKAHFDKITTHKKPYFMTLNRDNSVQLTITPDKKSLIFGTTFVFKKIENNTKKD